MNHRSKISRPALWLRALWFGLVPAALALLVAPRLPAPGPGSGGRVVLRTLLDSPLLVVVVLFVLFSALARYWRYYLPGGRWLFPLAPADAPSAGQPRELLRDLEEPAARLRWVLGDGRAARRVAGLPAEVKTRLAGAVGSTRAAIAAGDPVLARAGADRVGGLLGEVAPRAALGGGAAALTIALAAGAALFLRGTVAETSQVLSASMLPTLLPFDRVVSNKLAYGVQLPLADRPRGLRTPRRGDVVLFRPPEATPGPRQMVKRVIGLPGDRISMQSGLPIINGWSVPTCDAGTYVYPAAEGGTVGRLLVEFLDDRAYLTVHGGTPLPFTGTYLVKPGEVFVLGDNRNQSVDSRAWGYRQGAGVPLHHLSGRLAWLLGSDRNGAVDLSRLGAPQVSDLPMPGVDTKVLEAGIARCLKHRPLVTKPPSP